ncbi:MAG: GspH/FimT family protein [Azoarcus sp.]|nr:GspH/FimT family protein [Azoarcus sp.]
MSNIYKSRSIPHPCWRRRAGSGFTLVELMIALAVLAILAAVGMPSFQGIIANNRLASASNDILSGLNVAKSEAIRRNASIRFCVNPTTRAWQVVPMAGDAIRVGDLHSSVNVAGGALDTISVANNECVRFRPDGLAYSEAGLMDNGSFTLSLDETTRVIRVRTGALYAD